MQVKINSIAGMKRAISTPGIQIKVLSHWQTQLTGTTRTPLTLRASGKPGIQTNGYYFLGPSKDGILKEMWADIPKAEQLRFNTDGSVTWYPDTDRSWTLSFEQAAM